MRTYMKSRIELRVDETRMECEGSILIPSLRMAQVNIYPYEQVHVLNKTNGERFITYAIANPVNTCIVQGAAAHLVAVDDEVIVVTYEIR
jgi:aspartate 1-decarboxylase